MHTFFSSCLNNLTRYFRKISEKHVQVIPFYGTSPLLLNLGFCEVIFFSSSFLELPLSDAEKNATLKRRFSNVAKKKIIRKNFKEACCQIIFKIIFHRTNIKKLTSNFIQISF